VKGRGQQKEFHLQATPSGCRTPSHILFAMLPDPSRPPPPFDKEGRGQYWADAFSIDTMCDFQTKLMVSGQEQAGHGAELQGAEWYEPSRYTSGHRVCRVSVIPSSEDSSTLFVVVSNPALEEYVIHNDTALDLTVGKFFRSTGKADTEHVSLGGRQRVAFVWGSTEEAEKALQISCGSKSERVSLDQVTKTPQPLFKLKDQKVASTLELTETGTKVLKIKILSKHAPGTAGDEGLDPLEALLEPCAHSSGIKLDVSLRGVAFSVIDNEPKELIYLRADQVLLTLSQGTSHFVEEGSRMKEVDSEIGLSVGNLQIDNLLSDQMPVVLGSTKLYKPLLKEQGDEPLEACYLKIRGSDEEAKQES